MPIAPAASLIPNLDLVAIRVGDVGVGAARTEFAPPAQLATGDDYEGQIAASVTFYASGRMFRTDWFRFQVQVSHGEILRLDPVNIAARGARTLDDDEETQQELVKDVVKANAAHA